MRGVYALDAALRGACYPSSVSDEVPTQPEEFTTGLSLPEDMTIALWGRASGLVVPAGALLTIFQDVPVHELQEDKARFEPRPVGCYLLVGDQLVGSASLLVRQSILWATRHGGEGAGQEVVSKILEAIDTGVRRATEAGESEGEEE